VVWLLPPDDPCAESQPSFYPVQIGKGVVVVAQGGMVANLASRPGAQTTLLRLAEKAVRPHPPELPEIEPLN
jgi:hypothetical protein